MDDQPGILTGRPAAYLEGLGDALYPGSGWFYQVDALGTREFSNLAQIEFHFQVPTAVLALPLAAHRVAFVQLGSDGRGLQLQMECAAHLIGPNGMGHRFAQQS